MYRSLFPYDIFNEMDRMQRAMQQAFELSPNIRGVSRGGFPALNIGGTDTTVEVYAFAPGLSPESIDVHLERTTLSLSGERKSELANGDEKTNIHINERFTGRFRRVVNLPDDIDPDNVTATYRDGVLRISIKRKQAASPRRINIE